MISALRHLSPRGSEAALKRFGAPADLTATEIALVRAAAEEVEIAPAGTEIQREGEPVRRPRLILSGWACRQRVLADGRRQIFGFVVAGDLIGLSLLPSPRGAADLPAPGATLAITSLVTCDATGLRQAALDGDQAHAGIARALSEAVRRERDHLLDHVVRLGRLTAYERIGDLLLELYARLSAVGLAGGGEFPMPLTQELLADSLGLSVVHLNRVLQQYRRAGLLTIRSGRVTLLKPEAVVVAAGRSPSNAVA